MKKREIEVECDGCCISELLIKTQSKIDIYFLDKLFDSENKMKMGTIILVNGKNIHHLQKLDTIVNDGDIISLFPPGGGG